MTDTAESTRAAMRAAEAKRDSLAQTLEQYLDHLSTSAGKGAAGYGSSREVPRCLMTRRHHGVEGGTEAGLVYPGLKHDWQTLGSRDLAKAILGELLAAERKILELDAEADAQDASGLRGGESNLHG